VMLVRDLWTRAILSHRGQRSCVVKGRARGERPETYPLYDWVVYTCWIQKIMHDISWYNINPISSSVCSCWTYFISTKIALKIMSLSCVWCLQVAAALKEYYTTKLVHWYYISSVLSISAFAAKFSSTMSFISVSITSSMTGSGFFTDNFISVSVSDIEELWLPFLTLVLINITGRRIWVIMLCTETVNNLSQSIYMYLMMTLYSSLECPSNNNIEHKLSNLCNVTQYKRYLAGYCRRIFRISLLHCTCDLNDKRALIGVFVHQTFVDSLCTGGTNLHLIAPSSLVL